jgi:hypothetical protein
MSGLQRVAIEKRWVSQGLNPSYELSLECPAVRVVVTNANTVYLDN